MIYEYYDALYYHSSYAGTYLQPCLILAKSPHSHSHYILFFDPISDDYSYRWVNLEELTDIKPDFLP